MKTAAPTRLIWGKKRKVIPQLDFLKLQLESYQDFLTNGIREALEEITGDKGIKDYTNKTQ